MNEIFKALSDETRRKILKMLNEKDMTGGEIANKFPQSWPTISHHLEILEFPIILISLSYLLGFFVYNKLPFFVPTSWDLEGKINAYLPKYIALTFLPTISLILLLIFIFNISNNWEFLSKNKKKLVRWSWNPMDNDK